MKYIKTFEQFVNESAVNEGAGDSALAASLSRVADKLEKIASKETDKDLAKTYASDAKRYRNMSDMAKKDVKAAKRSFARIDTAAKDHLADYLPKGVAKKILNTFGYDMNESNQIVENENVINEDHIDDRKGQIQFILNNADKAGYPDLNNEEFVSALTDKAIENFYKMLELILTYNDSRE